MEVVAEVVEVVAEVVEVVAAVVEVVAEVVEVVAAVVEVVAAVVEVVTIIEVLLGRQEPANRFKLVFQLLEVAVFAARLLRPSHPRSGCR